MSKKPSKIALSPLDDIFGVASQADDTSERIIDIALNQIHDFKDHPFHVRMNDEMLDLVESVKSYGVMMPGIARPRKEGGFELIAGHRRKFASQEAGKESMPIIIRKMDDDTATILMVHSNKQREDILPSERARSLKMLLEALNRQGQRNDLTSYQLGKKSIEEWSIAEATEKSGVNHTQIYRFIALTKLIPKLLDMVDIRRLPFTVGVTLSSLKENEQALLCAWMEKNRKKPTLKQAELLKERSKAGALSKEDIPVVMIVAGKRPKKLDLPMKRVRSYFPPDTPIKTIQETILKLLAEHQKLE